MYLLYGRNWNSCIDVLQKLWDSTEFQPMDFLIWFHSRLYDNTNRSYIPNERTKKVKDKLCPDCGILLPGHKLGCTVVKWFGINPKCNCDTPSNCEECKIYEEELIRYNENKKENV